MKDETRKLIEKTRAEIRAAQEKIDEQYRNLYNSVKSELADDDGEWLWEYIFNLSDASYKPYTMMVERKVFGETKE